MLDNMEHKLEIITLQTYNKINDFELNKYIQQSGSNQNFKTIQQSGSNQNFKKISNSS